VNAGVSETRLLNGSRADN